MSQEFDNLFPDEPTQQVDVQPEQQPATAEEVKPAETEAAVSPEADDDDDDDATAASEQGNGAHVPLIALQKTRQEKKDWKEKAVRFETELRLLKEQQAEREKAQSQPQQQAQPRGPLGPQESLINERMNWSQMMAAEKYPDLEEKIQVFEQAAKANRALAEELLRQPHPYEFAYKHASKLLAMKEIGDDPAAYKKRIEEQIRAELQGQQQTQQPAPTTQAAIPHSLAGARSAAPRNVGSFSGPPSFDEMFK